MRNLWRLGVVLSVLVTVLFASPVFGKDEKFAAPKEFGVYVKTPKGLVRIIPNIVFETEGVLYIEANNPARFMLKDVEFFVVFGKQDLKVLTINPMLFVEASSLGKARFIFGKEIAFDTRKRGNDLYVVRPKGLLGRGYFSLWIEDTAWDFFID